MTVAVKVYLLVCSAVHTLGNTPVPVYYCNNVMLF